MAYSNAVTDNWQTVISGKQLSRQSLIYRFFLFESALKLSMNEKYFLQQFIF